MKKKARKQKDGHFISFKTEVGDETQPKEKGNNSSCIKMNGFTSGDRSMVKWTAQQLDFGH